MRYILLTLFALLSACATASKINKVELGMSKAQVIDVMGEPESVGAGDHTEVLNYALTETRHRISYPYFVKLVDGKVTEYGRMPGASGTNTEHGFGMWQTK